MAHIPGMHNEHIVLEGRRLRLVPYLEHHVPRYHQWMCDPELLEATCSDPLSLEEEYENQKSWLASDDKLTFILLCPLSEVVGPRATEAADVEFEQSTNDASTSAGIASESPLLPPHLSEAEALRRAMVMIGDVNLFVPPHWEDDGVEIEVMIAEKGVRRRGFAQEALSLVMSYAVRRLGFRHFVAKILEDNTSSQRLFTEKLHFELFKKVDVFHELHYERRLNLAAPVESVIASLEWESDGSVPFRQLQYPEDMEGFTELPEIPAELLR